jgi:hypothetical protein
VAVADKRIKTPNVWLIPGALPAMTGAASGETIELLSGIERPEDGADVLGSLEPEFASDLLTVEARPLKLAEQHPDVLAAQLCAPVVRDCDRRPRLSEATVAARAARHLGKAVREQPADQRSLGQRHLRRL